MTRDQKATLFDDVQRMILARVRVLAEVAARCAENDTKHGGPAS